MKKAQFIIWVCLRKGGFPSRLQMGMAMWELVAKIADWIFKRSPYWQDYQKIKREYESIKQERDALKEKCDIMKDLVFKEGLYWDKTNPDDAGPFCQPCADTGKARSHLHGSDEDGWRCEVCDKFFQTATRRELERRAHEKWVQQEKDTWGIGPVSL